LTERAQGGDLTAYEELVRRHEDVAFRTAYLILRDPDDAGDAAQEAFVRAHQRISRFKAGGQFRPWLMRIVVNQALNMQKARRRRRAAAERLTAEHPPAEIGIDERIMERERARALWSALEALGERERAILYLRYFLQMSEGELAEYLGCAPGTVKSRIHRALQKLRDVIGRRYAELLSEAN
jgi:RNA polymerase sigma factor (sigma-70 family)